ncbi:MAG: thermopsin family protease [Metallosphaera sp.]
MKFLVLTLLVLSLIPVINNPMVPGHALAELPSHLRGDPSSSFYLLPRYYESFWCTVYTGQNVTGTLNSTNPVLLFVMNSSQYQAFTQSGSFNSLFMAYGNNISFNVGPLPGGEYYVVVENNGSLNANGFLSYSAVPLVPFTVHSTLPAPVGIADYGVKNTSKGLQGYIVKFNEVVGEFTVNSISAYNSTPPSGISPYSASLQLNVVLQVNTVHGGYQYWLQDVPLFFTNNDTMCVVDNVWNFTSYPSILSNSTLTGQGHVYSYREGNYIEYYYAYGISAFRYSTPFKGELIMRTNVVPQGVEVMFGFYNGTMNWYDNVTIHESGVTSAYMLVDGFNTTGSGNRYDAELVYGGGGSGEITNFNSMNSTLSLMYVVNGVNETPQELYGYGADTAEAADNLKTTLVNGVPTVTLGQENFYEPLYPVGSPFGHFSFAVLRAEQGAPVVVNVSVQVFNGVGPYTYRFYLDGTLVKAITGGSTLDTQLNLGVLTVGSHNLTVIVEDGLGQRVSGSTNFVIGVGPVITISSQTILDYGQPLRVTIQVNGGTPPYTVLLHVNGSTYTVTGDEMTLNLTPGTYLIYATVTDSQGVSSTSGKEVVVVNPDPTIQLRFPLTLDVGEGGTVTYTVSGGTPPYVVTLYLNGTPVGNFITFTSPGIYVLSATVRDSLNYTVSKTLVVTVNPDPTISVTALSRLDQGQANLINVSIEGGTPPYKVSYSIPGVLTSTTSNPNFTVSASPPPGNYTFNVTVKDSTGFVTSKLITFQVNPDPSLQVEYNSSITEVNIPVLLFANVSGGTPPYSLSWSTLGTSLGGSQTLVFHEPPGNYTVTLTLKDAVGFVVNRTVNILVYPRLEANISVEEGNSLVGGYAILSALTRGGVSPYSYTWLLNGERVGNQSSLNLSLSPGKYNVTLVVRDSFGVVSTSQVNVNVGYGYAVYLVPAIAIVVIGVAIGLRRRGT